MNRALKTFLLNLSETEKAEAMQLLSGNNELCRPLKEWLTINEVMTMFSVSRSTVLRMKEDYHWKTMKIGRKIYINFQDIQEVFHA